MRKTFNADECLDIINIIITNGDMVMLPLSTSVSKYISSITDEATRVGYIKERQILSLCHLLKTGTLHKSVFDLNRLGFAQDAKPE